MSTSRAIGAVAGYAAMALAIAVGVVRFMVADVRLALVAGAVVVAAVAVNLLLTLIDHRRTELLSTGCSWVRHTALWRLRSLCDI